MLLASRSGTLVQAQVIGRLSAASRDCIARELLTVRLPPFEGPAPMRTYVVSLR